MVGKWNVVIYLPIYERILCLISGFSRKTDSARFKALLTPATPKFNSCPDLIPIVKVEDLLWESKPFDEWAKGYDVGQPAGCTPLLILDVFEHAFMIDYGLKRADYIGAFFKNIKWEAVEGRLK